jgi:large subunit ribosomal protein L28
LTALSPYHTKRAAVTVFRGWLRGIAARGRIFNFCVQEGKLMARRCELTGKGVMSGNNVSHSHIRTRRRFLPNVQEKSLHSDALGRGVRLKVSTSAMRTVESKGGLDAYLLGAKDAVLSQRALRIKRAVEKAVTAEA